MMVSNQRCQWSLHIADHDTVISDTLHDRDSVAITIAHDTMRLSIPVWTDPYGLDLPIYGCALFDSDRAKTWSWPCATVAGSVTEATVLPACKGTAA